MCSRLNVVETHPRRRGSLSQGSVAPRLLRARLQSALRRKPLADAGAIGQSLDPTQRSSLVRVRYWNAVEMPLHAPHHLAQPA